MNNTVVNYLKRSVCFLLSLFIMAYGVSLSVRASLGTSPISSIPYVLSLYFPLSMGQITILLHIVLLLGQVLLLRRNFKWFNLLQLPLALVFGYFTDYTLELTKWIAPKAYWEQFLLLLVSILFLAMGVFLLVQSRLIVLAGEGLMLAISKVTGKEFGKVKMFVDLSMVVIAAAFSLLALHSLQGVREGTLIAALCTGLIVRFLTLKLTFITHFLQPEAASAAELPALDAADTGIVITIARQFGSGGLEIGKKLAEKLGYTLVDRQMLDLAAQESGLSGSYVTEHEEKAPGSLFYNVYSQNFNYVFDETPFDLRLFEAQSIVIRRLAKKGNIIFIGRLGNFILKGRKNTLNVFVCADDDYRSGRIMKADHVSPALARKAIVRRDTERKNHCKVCTGMEWTDAGNYSMTVKTSDVGIDGAVDLILAQVNRMKKQTA